MVLGERHKPRAGFFLRLSELSRRLARGTGGEGGIRNIQNSNALSRISFWSHKSAYISWDPSGPQVAARNIGREIRDDGGPQTATTRHSSRRGETARLRRERPLPAHCRCCGFCAEPDGSRAGSINPDMAHRAKDTMSATLIRRMLASRL